LVCSTCFTLSWLTVHKSPFASRKPLPVVSRSQIIYGRREDRYARRRFAFHHRFRSRSRVDGWWARVGDTGSCADDRRHPHILVTTLDRFACLRRHAAAMEARSLRPRQQWRERDSDSEPQQDCDHSVVNRVVRKP